MRVISLHSHKGGAGKTTLALILGCAHAKAGRRVCVVDLDFVGSGIAPLLPVRQPKKYFNLCVGTDPQTRPQLDDLVVSYADEQMGKKKLDLILSNSSAGTGSSPTERLPEEHRRAVGLAGREPGAGIVGRDLEWLLRELAEAKYYLVILDCQPGLAYLSSTALEMATYREEHKHIPVFMTTPNRAHFYGLLWELTKTHGLALGRSIICVNRLPKEWGLTWEGLHAKLREEVVRPEESAALVGTFEHACRQTGDVNYAGVSELAETAERSNIGGKTGVSVPPRGSEIQYSDTPACRQVFGAINT